MPFESLACSLSVGLFFSAAAHRCGIAPLALRGNRYRVRHKRLPCSAAYGTTRERPRGHERAPPGSARRGVHSYGLDLDRLENDDARAYRARAFGADDPGRPSAISSGRRQPRIVVPECTTATDRPASRRRRPAARAATAGLPRNRYFFSGSGVPGCLNGNVLNIDFAWFCICSCICTNMFFDCSM